MENDLFKLEADYDTSKSAIYSTDQQALRMFGMDHHAAATIKPEMTLTDPNGTIIATMDVWAAEWKEAGQ